MIREIYYYFNILMHSKRKQAYLAFAKKGVIDMMPLNLAVIPWGILCGSLAIQRGFTTLEALLMPILVYAGAVQLVVIELINNNVPLLTILVTTFIISSRHFLYGLALRKKLTQKPIKWRVPIAFLLTDELFALSSHRKAYQGKLQLIYALFAGGSFYLNWLFWNILGIIAGSSLPDLTQLGLDFAIAVTFIALVIPSIINLSRLITVCVAAALSILLTLFQWDYALIISALVAMLCGYITTNIYLPSSKSIKNTSINNSDNIS